MNRGKQIEEMAKDLENHTCMSQFQSEIASRMLYNAGYRKASDVAEDIIRMLRAAGINEWRYPIVADIKKKYLEGEG